MTVAALFLDLDNTLIDTDASMRIALVSAFAGVAGPLPEDVADRFVEAWWADPGCWYKRYEAGELTVTEQRYRRYLDVAREFSAPADAFETWQDLYVNGVVRQSRPFDDTHEFLTLVADLPLAVVTNVETPIQVAKIAAVGLTDLLPDVLGADLAERAKPDPALFELACARLGVQAPDVVHVGDSWDADVDGAQAAGMRAVWLDRYDTDPSRELPEGVHRVTSLLEIPALLGR